MRLAVAAVLLIAATASARADLEICNRTSFVIEAALGIESKGAAATRGWFRINPGLCAPVLRGEIAADRMLVHARALPLYGALRQLNEAHVQLCAGDGDFLVAGATKCTQPNQRMLPFAVVQPRKGASGASVTIAESAGYDPEQARFAAIQRLLTLAGHDAEPIDGVAGAKSDAALAAFLKSRGLPPDAAARPDFFDTLLAAAGAGAASGLLWCNDTKYTVMAALGVERKDEIATRGWWRIEPGACVRPDLPRQRTGKVFSFAEAIDERGNPVEVKGRALAWGGAQKLCTKNIRFEIREHEGCEARGLDARGFATVDFPDQAGATIRFQER